MTIVSEQSGRMDFLHGDEGCVFLTMAEKLKLETLTKERLDERMADREAFFDLMTGIEPTLYYDALQRIVLNITTPNFNMHNVNAITTAAKQIADVIGPEARKAWGEECEELAIGDL